MTTFYIIASLITLALAAYASYLLYKLHKQKQARKLLIQELEDKHKAQVQSIVESITSIAKAMQQQQCPVIEGCIRLKVLIDQLRLGEMQRANFKVFYTIYDKTAHIPTHQAWKDLRTKDKLTYTRQMMELEAEYESDINDAVNRVLVRFKS